MTHEGDSILPKARRRCSSTPASPYLNESRDSSTTERAPDQAYEAVSDQAIRFAASRFHVQPAACNTPGTLRRTGCPGAAAQALPGPAYPARYIDLDRSPTGLSKPRKSPRPATQAERLELLRSKIRARQPLPGLAECSHCCCRSGIEPPARISSAQSPRDLPASSRPCVLPHRPRMLPPQAAVLSCKPPASTVQLNVEVPIPGAEVRSERSCRVLPFAKASKR